MQISKSKIDVISKTLWLRNDVFLRLFQIQFDKGPFIKDVINQGGGGLPKDDLT